MIENKKNKKKSITMFFLKMLLIFIVLDLLMMILSNVLASSTLLHKYGVDLITEVFYALAVLIVMLLFKNSYVFTTKKEGFWSGVCLAVPMIIISFVTFYTNIISLESFSLVKFLNVIVLCVFIGIAEEFLCRGWLQNEFIERFSSNRREVVTSIILASLVFGFMHIINIGTQTVFETILQIINATALGMLLGSVYYKTKNIWSVIFLHAFYDFTIFLGQMNLVKDCTYNTPTFGVTVVNCVSIFLISSLWVASAFWVLNKCEFKFERRKNEVETGNKLRMIIITIFVFMLIPIHKLVPEYENYEVCYTYDEIDAFESYTLHFPYKKEYVIASDVEKITYDTDAFSDELMMNESIESLKYSFILNDNNTVNVKSNSTGYEIKLDFKDVENLEVVETEEKYLIAILTSENESTVYYYEILKTDMVNESTFFDKLEKAYTINSLPQISSLGYITIDGTENKYIYAYSMNSDEFVIMNNQLFLIKEK